ncbi:hypothetical protein SAMN04515677_101346 [Romboutsia lituseburensis DSM 797]|uniref:Glycine zipper-like domain-containing protein n=1 Tax=Romboutsia lituseburensis DSM 797 TaxID=1121325 RepID=A0A1G9IQJ2_9FIRM|nr:hypothetical protein SAMN04515677_101346 [Romboutsia lituseburensis DSM 797]
MILHRQIGIYKGKDMKNKNISYVGLGLCLGVSFGLVFDNLAIGIGIGLALGAGLDSGKNK